MRVARAMSATGFLIGVLIGLCAGLFVVIVTLVVHELLRKR